MWNFLFTSCSCILFIVYILFSDSVPVKYTIFLFIKNHFKFFCYPGFVRSLPFDGNDVIHTKGNVWRHSFHLLTDVAGGGKTLIPVCGFEASLQSCNAVVGPLLDVFGHLLNPPNDEGVAGASRMVLWSARPSVEEQLIYMHSEWTHSIYSESWMQPILKIDLMHYAIPLSDFLYGWICSVQTDTSAVPFQQKGRKGEGTGNKTALDLSCVFSSFVTYSIDISI